MFFPVASAAMEKDGEMTGEPSDAYGTTDVIEPGAEGRPPRRIAVGFAVILIVAAAMVGYLFGTWGSDTVTPSPTPPATQPIAATGKRCSAQLDDRMQLGIEIVNQSATAMTLQQVDAVLPLDGLRATVATWGSCGQLPPTATGGDYPLPAGGTTWLAITFDVLVPCPGSIPVRFTVHYRQAGRADIVGLPGFPDLGDIPYTSTKCPPAY